MANELAGKVAIVTGGASGIGAATVELFIEEGARVVIADIDIATGEALAARLGGHARFKRTDVSDRRQIQALVDYTVGEFGAVHTLFNNAGITGAFHNRFLDDPLEDFEDVMRTDLGSVMYASQCVARQMVKQGTGGSIINNSSIAAMLPSYAIFSYRAAKAGIINFTRSAAIDLGEHRIRVNAIAPGHIPTKLNAFEVPGLPADRQAELTRTLETIWLMNQPLDRRGAPRDCANMAMFLASDRSAFITGQVIAVDGGVTAGEAMNQNGLLTQAREQFLNDE